MKVYIEVQRIWVFSIDVFNALLDESAKTIAWQLMLGAWVCHQQTMLVTMSLQSGALLWKIPYVPEFWTLTWRNYIFSRCLVGFINVLIHWQRTCYFWKIMNRPFELIMYKSGIHVGQYTLSRQNSRREWNSSGFMERIVFIPNIVSGSLTVQWALTRPQTNIFVIRTRQKNDPSFSSITNGRYRQLFSYLNNRVAL